MIGLDDYHRFGEEIERRLRLRTFPLGVKLLGMERDVPWGAKRPKKDLGYQLSLCQAFSISRRQGETIAMLKEDHWCFEPVIGYALAEPTDYYNEGHVHFPLISQSLEAGKNWARSLPRLEFGKYIGMVFAPLMTANFEPDLVLIYCNSAQLQRLLAGRGYKEGRLLTCTLSSECVCVHSVVPVMLNGQCQVAIPCWGDRMRAMAQDDELVFSVAKAELEDLMIGIRYFDEAGLRLPLGLTLMPEYEFHEPYEKMARMLGLKVDK